MWLNLESFQYNWLNELTYVLSIRSAITMYAYDVAGSMVNQTVGSTTTKNAYGTNEELSSIGKVNFIYHGDRNARTISNGSTELEGRRSMGAVVRVRSLTR